MRKNNQPPVCSAPARPLESLDHREQECITIFMESVEDLEEFIKTFEEI